MFKSELFKAKFSLRKIKEKLSNKSTGLHTECKAEQSIDILEKCRGTLFSNVNLLVPQTWSASEHKKYMINRKCFHEIEVIPRKKLDFIEKMEFSKYDLLPSHKACLRILQY